MILNTTQIKFIILFISASILSSCGVVQTQENINGETATQAERKSPGGGSEEKGMMSKELEVTLNKAYKDAHDNRYKIMTVEQLLLALLENPSAAQLLRLSDANIELLRSDLVGYIEENTPLLDKSANREIEGTLEFKRVLQRSVFHVQTAGHKEVIGGNVLIAIFGEKESHAVSLLNEQKITRLDVVKNWKELNKS